MFCFGFCIPWQKCVWEGPDLREYKCWKVEFNTSSLYFSHIQQKHWFKYCPSLFSIAVINTRTECNLERKVQSIVEESQSRTQPGGKKLKQRLQRNAVPTSFPMAYSASLLIQPKTTCLGIVPPTVGLGCSHQSLTKKMFHRLVHRPIWWRHFLKWGFSSQMTPICVKLINQSINQ